MTVMPPGAGITAISPRYFFPFTVRYDPRTIARAMNGAGRTPVGVPSKRDARRPAALRLDDPLLATVAVKERALAVAVVELPLAGGRECDASHAGGEGDAYDLCVVDEPRLLRRVHILDRLRRQRLGHHLRRDGIARGRGCFGGRAGCVAAAGSDGDADCCECDSTHASRAWRRRASRGRRRLRHRRAPRT